ncbi:MAG TPA: radical SAM protein [Candidatus Krumholzibacteria bacterium]|nr:radical SAM protein [Candidatus Krumholzibacteria bacterium]HPD70225.1 radical SAM protein [Candidatus Krumholzibacteria bacterium]HRY40075.1 radical SAM protein [Candidatus Krumholzibacteria bacterium]
MSAAGELRAVTLLVTRACNLSCRYCPRDRRRRESMRAATLRRALDLVLDLAGPQLDLELSGGEPLLAPDRLRDVLARVRGLASGGPDVRCHLVTNGLLLDRDTLDLLVDHDVALQLSCDGPRGQDERRPGTFPALDRLFQEIRRRHPGYWRRRVSVSAVFTPATVGDLARAVACFLQRDVPALAVAPACGRPAVWGETCCAELERQLALVFDLAVAHRRRTGRVPVQHLRAADETTSAAVCGAGTRASLVVDTDGTVHGCSLLARSPRSRLGRGARRLAAALAHGDVADAGFAARWRRSAEPADEFAILQDRAGWTGGGQPCRACPLVATCRACPLAGPVPGRVPDAHCLFQRLTDRDRRRFPLYGPLAQLVRPGGLTDRDLQRLDRWFRT